MATPITHKILDEAVRVLEQNPGGMRFAKLVEAVTEKLPDLNPNTVFTQVSLLSEKRPNEVTRPSRGLYQLASAALEESDDSEKKEATAKIGKTYLKFV